jgi:hypothetical protein
MGANKDSLSVFVKVRDNDPVIEELMGKDRLFGPVRLNEYAGIDQAFRSEVIKYFLLVIKKIFTAGEESMLFNYLVCKSPLLF